ncbi:MAG: hypothetical protein ACOY3X_13590 [Pseudomonadota bacterium]
MSGITGAVYDPPRADLPCIAVIFKPDGEVLVARRVPTAEAGEALIAKVFEEFAKQAGGDVKLI